LYWPFEHNPQQTVIPVVGDLELVAHEVGLFSVWTIPGDVSSLATLIAFVILVPVLVFALGLGGGLGVVRLG
jgi:hypothetical protein